METYRAEEHRSLERIDRIADFLSRFRQQFQEAEQKSEQTFNIFSLLGIKDDEPRHSRFLAWLLDASAGHGLREEFLLAFIDLAGLALSREDLTAYVVRTEFAGLESRIDIVIHRRHSFLIYIENKIFAEEGVAQIDRELRDMRRLGARLNIAQDRQFAIFLTPDGRSPTSGDATPWRTVSYTQLGQTFHTRLPLLRSAKARGMIEDWIDTVSRFQEKL